MGVKTNMSVSLAICSSIHQSGKSMLAFFLAHRLAKKMKKGTTILVCCTCMEDGDIRNVFEIEDDYLTLEDLVNADEFSSELGMDKKGLLYKGGDIFFIDTAKATPLFVRRNLVKYQELLQQLKQDFDLVIADTSSDSNNPLTQHILDNCDHVLSIEVQDVLQLEKKTFTASKNTSHTVNRYEAIYPDKKVLSRLLKTKNVSTLPYCSQLQEMKNRHKLCQYAELDTKYIKAVDKLAEHLIAALNLPKCEREKNKNKGKSFIKLLRKGGKQ